MKMKKINNEYIPKHLKTDIYKEPVYSNTDKDYVGKHEKKKYAELA